MKIVKTWILFICMSGSIAKAQVNIGKDSTSSAKFTVQGYGEMTYSNFNWETFPEKRNTIDLNRVVFEPEYRFNDKLKLEIEVEFEHGGTGSTMEFDRFEEFGEFEVEIEKGGEVTIEALELAWQIKPWLELKTGRIRVPFGHLSAYDEPLSYMTTGFNNVEATLIPETWFEYGIGAEAKWKNYTMQLVLVNGLDNSAFSSANWIQRGNQTRFEYVNADAFALTARLDYSVNDDIVWGISSYIGNSTPNRPKPDITENGFVQLFDGHAHAAFSGFTINALALSGKLQNSAIITEANRNLSNNLNVKRTPVAAAAFGYFIEAGYNILSKISNKTNRLDIFCGYYYYDSMHKTSGDVFNNPRWQRTEIRTGLNYVWNKNIAIKSDFNFRTIGIPELNKENTFTLAFAYSF